MLCLKWRVSRRPPPFSALPSLPPSILLGKGSGGTPPSEGLRWRLDQFSAGLFGQIKRTSCLIAFRIFCRVFMFSWDGGGGTDPSHHCYSCHSRFNFSAGTWRATQPSPPSYGPCGVVIAFLDDFLFKSAVLLIFQMK